MSEQKRWSAGKPLWCFMEFSIGLRGGRGKCEKCGEWHSNVAYHRRHDCKGKETTKENK